MKIWRRSDINLRDMFVHPIGPGPVTGDELVYEVVGLIDDPVVVLKPRDDRDGEDCEHYVISSRDFAEWKKLVPVGPN